MRAVINTLKKDWSELLVPLVCLVAALSIFVDTPMPIQTTVGITAQYVWTILIILGSVSWGIHVLLAKKYSFIGAIGAIGLTIGGYVYLVALLFSPTASWFVIIILLIPTCQGIDRSRYEKRVAKQKLELLAVISVMEKRRNYGDDA